MKEYTKKPESQSRTLDSNQRPSKQAPIADILQAYRTSSVFQFDREIHDTVFYGRSTPRRRYLATDSSADNSMPHLTVDTLNEAINLTNEAIKGAPMQIKRQCIMDALNPNNNYGLSQDEVAWKQWLNQRQAPLLMNEMNGEQCRADMRMDNDFWKGIMLWILPSTQNMIRGIGPNLWQEEAHDVNVDRTLHSRYSVEATQRDWNDAEYTAHDAYVDNYNGDPLRNEIKDDEVINNIFFRTDKWLTDVVMDKFWRLTSLMGMDFFVARGKHIDFIRANNEGTDPDPQTGRRSITDSEWLHAQNQGYLMDGNVTRKSPIQAVSIQKKEARPKDLAKIRYVDAAEEFEDKLGQYLAENEMAKTAVSSLVSEITNQIPIASDTVDKYGTDDKGVTGMVGKSLENLQQVKNSGNIREQLTMIYNLTRSGVFEERSSPQRIDLKYLPEEISMRNDRQKIGENDKHIIVKPALISPQLSQREEQSLGAKGHKNWKSGASNFHYKMGSAYQRGAQRLLAITSTGISGTSYMMLHVAKAYNADLSKIRLALLGWMIPARDHTFHEIMTACNHFDAGLEYINTPERYRYISPITEETLRSNVAKNRQFPDEIAGLSNE